MNLVLTPVNPAFTVSWTLPGVLFVILFLTYYVWCRTSKNGRLSDALPGPKLNVLRLFVDGLILKPYETIQYGIQKSKLQKTLFRARIGHKTFVFIYNAPDIEVSTNTEK